MPSGLSPRVRGNRGRHPGRHGYRGSIPACAGEPAATPSSASPTRVYPRVCGGTGDNGTSCLVVRGLSPRVRGNPPPPSTDCQGKGSIPACVGEPSLGGVLYVGTAVYPRVCGGTACLAAPAARRPKGLSPRVRGNLGGPLGGAGKGGSIPACAGEPSRTRTADTGRQVYPRVCGGTLSARRAAVQAAGLSPRVRGNLVSVKALPVLRRSIPACAGEPFEAGALARVQGVYPRVCGGTAAYQPQLLRRSGLSPRVRGNRADDRWAPVVVRSIPACAGEPSY